MRNIFLKISLILGVISLSQAAFARDVTLRVHHFMSESSNLHKYMLVPLAKRIDVRTNGRLKLKIYPSMTLGGRAPELYDQAIDGAVDIVLTLPGYTAGRFPRSEVFELPFIMRDHIATAETFWDLVADDFQNNEYQDTKILAAWVHGPGALHTEKPVTKLEDLRGMELRGATSLVTDLIGKLGGIPVGMPLPKIPESLAKGVISGAALPWEITPSIKIPQLVRNHTQFTGERALYTAALILAMNWDSYEALPDDLRKILDDETGKFLSAFSARVIGEQDLIVMRSVARSLSNKVITLNEREVARWIEASKPVYRDWIESTARRGFDGAALIRRVQDLMLVNER